MKLFQNSHTSVSLLILLSFVVAIPSLYAAITPTDFQATPFVSGLQNPTAMAFAPDGRLFVTQQTGAVRVIKDGVLLSTPFLSLSVLNGSELGLLGIAFDPNFSVNRYIYVYYTAPANHNRLSRFQASATNPDIAAAGSEVYMVANIGDNDGDGDTEVSSGFHNGGAIHFGSDGMLYVGIGDHGNTANAQSLGTLTGKILRLNVSNYPGSIIPSNNPFVGQQGARGEIYAYGVRNPYTLNVDSVDGRININDVGGSQEEINRLVAGANYGWPACQGGPCNNALYVDPLSSYPKASLGGCAITGGVFYRGSQFPSSYNGLYFFSDYCGDFIRSLNSNNTQSAWSSEFGAPVDLQVGLDGLLYVLERSPAGVTRIAYTGGTPTPTPSVTPIPKPGDIDRDGDVDIFDYSRFVARFGQTGSFPEDIDSNGTVNIFDYNILVANFGR